jgi:hypothetical protein
MATIQVRQNGVKDLNLGRFRAVLDKGGSLAKGCRFLVTIRIPQAMQEKVKTFTPDLDYLCEAADFPGRSFSVTQARYYGPSQIMPVNSEYQPMTLTFICRADSSERRFFDDWLDYINPTSNFNFEYPNNYYSVINIYQYAEWGSPGGRGVPQITYNWRLNKAWPTLVGEQGVNWAEGEYLRLQVTFAYKYWDRPNLQ